MLRGLDVWSGQETVPWKELEDLGFRFVIVKCKQGNDGVDSAFLKDISEAKSRGWIVGSYHFAYPLPQLDPIAQAEGFFKASDVGTNIGELPPALDFEWPAPEEWAKHNCNARQMNEWARKCATRMKELWGTPIIIYMYRWFRDQLVAGGADVSWMADHLWWPADYKAKGRVPSEAEAPFVPAPFKTWTFWQHDGDGGLKFSNGVDSDFDVFNGTEEDLQILAGNKPDAATDSPVIHPTIDTSEEGRDLGQSEE